MGKAGIVTEFRCKDLRKIKLNVCSDLLRVKVYPIAAGKSFGFEESFSTNLNLKEYLLKNPKMTNMYNVVSDSMEPEIRKGDKLIIDRKIVLNKTPPELNGKLVAVIYENEGYIKRYKWDGKNLYFMSDNPLYEPLKVQDFQYYQIWGMVTFLIREARDISKNNPVRKKYLALKEIIDILDSEYNDQEKLSLINKAIRPVKP